jgi:hypothetical protein
VAKLGPMNTEAAAPQLIEPCCSTWTARSPTPRPTWRSP